jgi:hypothetical protein
VVLSGTRRGALNDEPMLEKIDTSSEVGLAADVQVLVLPVWSEKKVLAVEAMSCIVVQAEMCVESVEQLPDDDVEAP